MPQDVIVIGGGPAGTAAAIVLARAGARVALYERTCYEQERLGESLSPAVGRWLQRLGVPLGNLTTTRSPGVISLWEHDTPQTTDYFLTPEGDGYHLQRSTLDRALAEAARAAGANMHQGQEIHRCHFTGEYWQVQTRAETVNARWLIDASGRSGKLPVSRYRVDKLVAVVAHLCGGTHADQRLAIEATAAGWWYDAPLPDGQRVVAWLTDVDLLPTDPLIRRQAWEKQLSHTRLIAPRLVGTTIRNTRTVLAGMSVAKSLIGEQWCLVGDAALAHDPLSGRGVLAALEHGYAAGEAVALALRNDPTGLDSYRQTMIDYLQLYTATRRDLYDRVRHWPHAPFWVRRLLHEEALVGD